MPEEFADRWGVPVLLENDARAYALREAAERPGVAPLVAVKYAHGIGAGIVVDGQLLCGMGGSAGDIGHIRVASGRGRRCRCGRTGCLAAYASGHALLRELRRPASSSMDELVARIPAHQPTERAVRRAAALLGEALAGMVATLNPQQIVMGGILGRQPLVVDEVRPQIATGAIERVTAPLRVDPSAAHHPVAAGLAGLVVGHVYAPDTVDLTVSEAHQQ